MLLLLLITYYLLISSKLVRCKVVHRDSQIDHTAVHTLDQMLLPTDDTLVHNPNSVSKLRLVHTLVIVVL